MEGNIEDSIKKMAIDLGWNEFIEREEKKTL